MTIAVDDLGVLRSPSLHDGLVLGIMLSGEDAATVALRDVQGQDFSMRLTGAEGLVCDNFLLGNIISEIWITSGKAPHDDALDVLFAQPHPAAAKEFHDQHAAFVKRKMDEIREGSLKLVSIDSSYGCRLTALCREVEISADR
ncbi:MAG: hypothetical protein JSR61_01810 [Proteobacteria bacterium]|nr:hypothetical protein [Pseudomonadota bacterium]